MRRSSNNEHRASRNISLSLSFFFLYTACLTKVISVSWLPPEAVVLDPRQKSSRGPHPEAHFQQLWTIVFPTPFAPMKIDSTFMRLYSNGPCNISKNRYVGCRRKRCLGRKKLCSEFQTRRSELVGWRSLISRQSQSITQ